jgi:hypothetical protein
MSRSSNQSTSAGVVCFFTAFTNELLCNCDLLSGPARRHLEASGVPVENRYFPMQTHYIFYMLAWMCLHSFSGEFSLVLSLMGLIVNVYTCLRLGLILILTARENLGLDNMNSIWSMQKFWKWQTDMLFTNRCVSSAFTFDILRRSWPHALFP